MCVCAWAGACTGGVRFSNSNRIIPSDYRILLLLKMPVTRFEGQGRKDEEVRGDEPEKGCLITQNKTV